MRAVAYIRVSDEDQVNGFSLDVQRRTFHEFCAQKGWEVVGIYNEEGRSAWVESITKRPTFREMLEASQADKFDVVVTHTLDRFTRNLRVMLDAFHTFSQHNVTYVSIAQDIDYTTPEGRLFMTMLGAFAQYFSDVLSNHTKKGMRERAMQGMFNGEPPFGYERCDANCIGIDENHTGCHIDPVAGPAMLTTFEKYRSGSHSYRTLAEELNRQGFRTKGRLRPDPDTEAIHDDPDDAQGALFTGWSIRDLLSNRFFLGEIRHKGEYYPGCHQPLVGEELFNEVQERIKENRSRKSVSVSRSSRNLHMLTGLLRCHRCGTKLWSQRQGQDGKTYYPMKAFNDLLQAMDYGEDVEVWATPYGEFTRDGGDGGGRGSSVLTWPFNVRLRRSSPSKQRTISGPVIKQSRIALRISQTDLAASLGIDRQTLRSWEKGDTVPSRRYQNLLLKCLDARVQT